MRKSLMGSVGDVRFDIKLVHLDEVWVRLVKRREDDVFFGWVGVERIHATRMIRLFKTSTCGYWCSWWV